MMFIIASQINALNEMIIINEHFATDQERLGFTYIFTDFIKSQQFLGVAREGTFA